MRGRQGSLNASKEMIHVADHIHPQSNGKPIVHLKVDRRTLAKRRWRGKAEDGTDFGFDLTHPLADAHAIHENETAVFRIKQSEETVLRIPFSSSKQAAYYGWMVGNMHFSAAFEDDCVIAEDDPAVRQMLERNHIHFEETTTVFHPTIVSSGHSH